MIFIARPHGRLADLGPTATSALMRGQVISATACVVFRCRVRIGPA